MWITIILCLAALSAIVALVGVFLGFSSTRNQKSQMESDFRTLKESFEGLSRSLLVQNQEQSRSQEQKASAFRSELAQELLNNRKELQHGLSITTQALETKVTSIDLRLDTRLKEMSEGVQSKLEKNVKEGFRHFEKVQEHLKAAEIQLMNLNNVGQSIHDLNNLLKLPHLRGSFGEASLERLLADCLPVDSYEMQYRVVPNSTERVDAVIKYPRFVLPIDSKFPREQILPLFETNDPKALEEARKNLVEVMRVLGKSIKEKYIHPEHGTSEMALLFVPSETLYFEVLRNPKLCDELSRNKVFPVSPNTLSVTLHSVAVAREYYEMAKGVEKTISDLKKANTHLNHFESKFEDMGNSLGKAQNAFNIASTHLSRYSSSVSRLTGAEALAVTSEVVSLPNEPGAAQTTADI